MANKKGERGEPWSEKEVEILLRMAKAKAAQYAIAVAVGRSVSAVEGKLRTIRETEEMGPILGPGLARYEAPPFHENDERKHLQALYDANGYGFSWWPPSLMERIYLLERSPPAGKPFWRAA